MAKNKYIETPEKMLEYFESYVKETKNAPILVQDFVGKDGNEVYRTKEKPLTIEGFEIWCFTNDIISDLSQYFANTENRYTDYQTICSHIKRRVRNDQIMGGMAGIYNPSITQRLNNLVEKTDNNNTGDVTITVKYDEKPNDNA
jgi:hypothetical protein